MKTACLLILTMALLPCLPAAAAEKEPPATPPAEASAKPPPDTSARPAAKAATDTQTPATGSLKDALPGKKSAKPSSKKKAIQLNLCDQ